MKHLGDITKINGAEIEPVDCIIGGSPCQDLSQAKTGRQGLSGDRSCLFLEQIRIFKEMRENALRTIGTGTGIGRFLLWENVIGAMSSGTPRGADFQRVISECVRIVEKDAPLVRIPQAGWTMAGTLLGRGWSIAWRVVDLQHYGCPQRRKRLALLCDFDGMDAPNIIFEKYPARRIGSGQEIHSVEKSMSGDFGENEKAREDSAEICGRHSDKAIFGLDVYNKSITGDVSKTLTHSATDADHVPSVIMLEMQSTKHRVLEDGISPTLKSRMGTGGNCVDTIITNGYVRKLTPVELERLQGFPDNWTNIGDWVDSKSRSRKSTDALRMKALGNSIGIPAWMHIIKGISVQYDRPATMGSLFDGIGGFPRIWEHYNGKGTARWASEIDEFCVAVTKHHFPEE